MGDRHPRRRPKPGTSSLPPVLSRRPKALESPAPEATHQACPHSAPGAGAAVSQGEAGEPRHTLVHTQTHTDARASGHCRILPWAAPPQVNIEPPATFRAPVLPPRTLTPQTGREPVVRGRVSTDPHEDGVGGQGQSRAAPTSPLAAPGSQQLTGAHPADAGDFRQRGGK